MVSFKEKNVLFFVLVMFSIVLPVLRTKLVKAKVDQLQKRVLVSSTMHRTFGRPQWQQLRDTLSKWALNLGQVQHTIQAAIHSQYESLQA
jgi:translation initiation factor 3 subunit M